MLQRIIRLIKRLVVEPRKTGYHFYRRMITNSVYKFCLIKQGKGCWIGKPLLLSAKHTSMGDEVYIWPNCRIEAVTVYLDHTYNPSIRLEDCVTIQQNLHLTCANRIVIGRNSAIGANVTITDINHPYTNIHLPPEKQQLEISTVEIGEDCKIYNNSVILPGVFLGKHTIVGANSVVLPGIYPDFVVIAGIPGKIVKQYNPTSQHWEKK